MPLCNFQNLNPLALEFKQNSEHFVSSNIENFHSTLNADAHVFVPRMNSNIIDSANTDFNDTPMPFRNLFESLYHSTLNPRAPIFVPSSNSNDFTYDFNTTPEVFDAMTPNNSFRENFDSTTFHDNPGSIFLEFLLSDGLILFLLIFILLMLFLFTYMLMNVEAESSDQDHEDSDQPQNILQLL